MIKDIKDYEDLNFGIVDHTGDILAVFADENIAKDFLKLLTKEIPISSLELKVIELYKDRTVKMRISV